MSECVRHYQVISSTGNVGGVLVPACVETVGNEMTQFNDGVCLCFPELGYVTVGKRMIEI